MFTHRRVPLFTLPFVLIFAAALIAGCSGKDVDLEADATAAADTPPVSELHLRAKNNNFDMSTLVLTANAEITISFENADGSTLHNVAIYEDEGASELVYRGDLFTGAETRDYTFTAPEAGVYFFRCDVHPDTMVGTVVVKDAAP